MYIFIFLGYLLLKNHKYIEAYIHEGLLLEELCISDLGGFFLQGGLIFSTWLYINKLKSVQINENTFCYHASFVVQLLLYNLLTVLT